MSTWPLAKFDTVALSFLCHHTKSRHEERREMIITQFGVSAKMGDRVNLIIAKNLSKTNCI